MDPDRSRELSPPNDLAGKPPDFSTGNTTDLDAKLLPPNCPSAEDWQRRLAAKAELPSEPAVDRSAWQFNLRDGTLAISAISVGLAGGTWMPLNIFLALLGLSLYAGIGIWPFLEHLFDVTVDDAIRNRIVAFLLIAYGTALAIFLGTRLFA